jgi:hypothetical protein
MLLAAQVTGLKRLVIEGSTPARDEQLVMLAARNTQLQMLIITGSHVGSEDMGAVHLQHLITSCSGLTELQLNSRDIDQDGLDTLLAHGTNITQLTLSSSSRLTASRAHVPCSWKVLKLTEPSLQQLAYLPLNSVQELAAGSSGNTLRLHLNSAIPAPQLLSLLSQATTNLAACPACNTQPQRFTGFQLAGTFPTLTPQQRVQLFEALAPLRVLQLERLSIATNEGLELGLPEVEALAHSLGDSIKVLEFWGCTVVSSFWRPLAQRLPNLQHLQLGFDARVGVSDLSFFLGMRSQANPDSPDLTVSIGYSVLDAKAFAELQANIAAWQLHKVQLERL